MPSQLPPPLPQALSDAPGAKASRTCGLLSILFAITCIGIPVAIVLGIIALVQNTKAKRLASEFPQEFRIPTSSGKVMGIVGLLMPILMIPFVGIVSAIAIPAYIGYQGQVVNKLIADNLENHLEALASEYERGKEVGLEQSAIQTAMEQILQDAQERNPADPLVPAFRFSISIVSAASEEEAALQAEAEANTPGEVVFVLAFPPEAGQSGYLAGAALLKVPIDEENTTSMGVSLD